MEKADHRQRAGQLWPVLTQTARDRGTLTYKAAASAIGIHWRPIAHALGPIQDFCLLEGLPRLTAVVHATATGLQGGGYLGVPGDEADLADVYAFDWQSVPNPFSKLRQDALSVIADELLLHPEDASDRYALTLSRGDAQHVFREAVLKAYDFRCAFCSFSFVEALDAAHIIPWASRRPDLRVDPRNGVCLCANHHRLFDEDRLKISSDYILHFDDPEGNDGDYMESDDAATRSLHGASIQLPESKNVWPDRELLQKRFNDED